jgi:MFS family permease
VLSGALAPWVGRMTDRAHPRWIAGFGMVCFAVALFWLAAVIGPTTAIWQLLLPIALLGVANGFVWAPIGTTATRNLPMAQAGAGAGVYNTTRQIGAVLGSAGIAVLMQSRLSALLPGSSSADEVVSHLPAAVHAGFSKAMAEALLLPAVVLLVGLAAVAAFANPRRADRK